MTPSSPLTPLRRKPAAHELLVVDSSYVVRTIAGPGSFMPGADRYRYIAPPLMWSEVRSVLHEALWRKELTSVQVAELRRNFAGLTVDSDQPPQLDDVAWQVADEMGWAKTYDAEYVALARIRNCRLVTTDMRMRRGADRLGFVVAPHEL